MTRNIEISFVVGGNSTEFTTTGWCAPEAHGRWTDGKTAALLIPGLDRNRSYRCEVILGPYLHSAAITYQDLSVSVGGCQLFQGRLTKGGTVAFDIPVGLVQISQDLEIKFEIPTAVSPKDLCVSFDDRKLGMSFWKALLAPHENRRHILTEKLPAGVSESGFRDAAEMELSAQQNTENLFLDIVAYCPICEADRRLVARSAWLRDQLVCPVCQSLPRHRALMDVLSLCMPDWRTAAMHEVAPVWHAASAKFRKENDNYTYSYFDPSTPGGATHPVQGWRNENIEDLTFPAQTFDLFITQDVFEHLFRPDRAAAEVARVLRPGGMHVCTVPIANKGLPSCRRAQIVDGTIRHLQAPQHHGDPVNSEGALVTVDWGYDIAAYLDRHSGLTTTIFYIDDLTKGIRADAIEVLVMRKTVPVL